MHARAIFLIAAAVLPAIAAPMPTSNISPIPTVERRDYSSVSTFFLGLLRREPVAEAVSTEASYVVVDESEGDLDDAEEDLDERALGFPKGGSSKRPIGFPKGGSSKRAIGFPKGGSSKRAIGFPKGGSSKRAIGFPKGGSSRRAIGFPKGGSSKRDVAESVDEASR